MTITRLQRTATNVSIAGFYEQYELNKFNFDPPYQRRSVWSEEKQSYFIDSLLRNFPIPPIFLHRKIDSDTGKTTYDVIDGKQRLTAIARFIQNEIPSSNEYGPGDVHALDGAYFKDLSSKDSLAEFRIAFWKYDLPVEYIDPSDTDLIEAVFDRLNRNGEPLTGQELRNAQYHSSPLIKAVDEILEHPFFLERLAVTDRARMEDKEFASECLLTTLTGQVIGSNRKTLDEMYDAFRAQDFSAPLHKSKQLADRIAELKLAFEELRINGVSHLYGLWSLALTLDSNGRDIASYESQLKAFYASLRSPASDATSDEYKRSMNSRTKERFMRVRRLNALLTACGEQKLVNS